MVTGHCTGFKQRSGLTIAAHGLASTQDASRVDGDHMSYGEDSPKNHASGFAVLTIYDGKLLYPEFCYVVDKVAYFRGQSV